ncbi:10631_t:CDS:2, partial [Gigaspora margarita]
LSQEQRSRIIGGYLCGFKPLHIAEALDLPKSTVYDTVNRYKETGSEHPNKRPGPQEVLSMRDKRSLVRIANQNRKAPLAVISNELNVQLGTTLTDKTTRKYLHDLGWSSCVACKKPFLDKKKALERKKWCREHLKWINEWQMVVFSDESRFCLHKSDGRERTWRRVNEKYHRDCINTTVKFNGGSVMFWGCFSWWGVGPLVEIEGNMDSDSYVNILANHFIPWANSLMKKYPNEIKLIFQQDLAPIHSSAYTKKPTPTKREELVRVVKEEWNKIQIEYLRSLICNASSKIIENNSIILADVGC